ncbi:hypothetical protein DCAR_0100623 [Daucus carota subsp. sativus]|uniref:BED-type domain-containing protein n=1 Tax=Daucus carota subsp. sativus TaxID=79200 RepID=A0AAF0W3L8_DAUCS|nr:hypothetical protein DCAR_0100623 [Daucus carota subsp. sativus]
MSSKKLLNPSKDDKPLWLHVEVLDAPIGGGDNRKWRCRYCNKIVTGSYTKVRAHLLKISNMGVEACKGISDDVYRQIEAEHKRAEEKVAKEAMNARQRNQYMAYQGGSDLVQPKKRKGALELAFNVADRDEIDKDCAMMFYTSGGGRGIRRVAPNEDEEISLNREACLRRIFDKPEDLKKVTKEYGAFACELEYFSQPHVMASRGEEDHMSWWANYGSFTPLLQGLAFKLLSQLASSSCCERNWSTYGSIQSVKRNQLATQRTEDLVYVHNNIRMISESNQNIPLDHANIGTLVIYIGGDNFDGDNILEIADLSLDDPEIEAITFDV